jgi:dsRNA-specific ribonuclease
MISALSVSMRNIGRHQNIAFPRNNYVARRFSSDTASEISSKIERLQERVLKIEGDRSGDLYKYGFAALGTVIAALCGAGYINKRIDDTKAEINKRIDDTKSEIDKRIDDTKSELKEKIGDSEKHLENRIELMEKHILDQIAISNRVLRLEDKKK